MKTSAPASSSPWAIMYPIPRVPPVTMAFLPRTEKSSCMSFPFIYMGGRNRIRTLSAESSSGFGAAGDVENLTGHEGRFLRSEKRDRGGDIPGLADSANGDVSGEGFLELLERHAHSRCRSRRHLTLDE